MPAYGGGDHNAVGLIHASNLHAEMLRLDDDQGSAGIEVSHQGVGDLRGESLLHLRPACMGIHGSGKLGKAHDAI